MHKRLLQHLDADHDPLNLSINWHINCQYFASFAFVVEDKLSPGKIRWRLHLQLCLGSRLWVGRWELRGSQNFNKEYIILTCGFSGDAPWPLWRCHRKGEIKDNADCWLSEDMFTWIWHKGEERERSRCDGPPLAGRRGEQLKNENPTNFPN